MQRLRSLLFVPGHRRDWMAKAEHAGADALILDLEDSVPPASKQAARDAIAATLARKRTMPLFVRVNALGSGAIDDDLGAVLAASPDAIVLPKADGAASLAQLDRRLAGSSVSIMAIASETPSAVFSMGSYGGVTNRLIGLTWGAEDLSASLGASTAREANGALTSPLQLVRSLTLFGAHAAGVLAIETVYPDFRDMVGLSAYAERGCRDGFSGMMAIHPAQVLVINAAFTPAPAELDRAQRIVEAFAANPEAGALQIDGKMVDVPHLVAAQRLLAARRM